MLSERRKGEYSAYGAAALWSLFPVITVATVTKLSPLFAAAMATGVSAVFFACLLTWKNQWAQLRLRSAWKDMLLATLCIGMIFYSLVFVGYRFTTPGNGAIVGLMEIFFAFVVVNLLWRHERFVPQHAAGALMMIVGALCILLPGRSGGWNIGDLLIVLATVFSPIGNIYMQRARKVVSAETMMFVRSAIGTLFLLGLALALEPLPSGAALADTWWQLLLSGIFLLGVSKILWMEAIHRLPITKVISITASEIFLTFVFAYVFLGQPVTMQQALSIVPMIGGLLLLTRKEG